LSLKYLYKVYNYFFQTSNGTIVGNINLIEFEEHQLSDLDMIVLASGDEGVVLQYINKVDRTINLSNLCVSIICYFL